MSQEAGLSLSFSIIARRLTRHEWGAFLCATPKSWEQVWEQGYIGIITDRLLCCSMMGVGITRKSLLHTIHISQGSCMHSTYTYN